MTALWVSLRRKDCVVGGLFAEPKAQLRGLGSAAPQRFLRGLLANPMLATRSHTDLKYSTKHLTKTKLKLSKFKTKKPTQEKTETHKPKIKSKTNLNPKTKQERKNHEFKASRTN